MAKKAYDPKKKFDHLSLAEQSAIEKLVEEWRSATLTAARRAQLLRKNPMKFRWVAAQPWTDSRHKALVFGARSATPEQRVKIGLPREMGALVAPRREPSEVQIYGMTPETYAKAKEQQAEIDAKYRTGKMTLAEYEKECRDRGEIRRVIAAEDRAKRPLFGMTKEEYEAGVREAAAIQLRVRREELDKRPFYGLTEEQYRAQQKRAAAVRAEIAATERKKRPYYGMTESEYRAQEKKAGEISAEARRGTPNEQRAVARLKAGRGYSPAVAVRLYDEGVWPAMERLDPGCTEKVFERWVEFETSKWTGRLQRGKEPWKITVRDVAESKLSMAQLSQVAAASKPIRDQLANLGIRVERPRPVGDYLGAVTEMYREYRRAPEKGRFFWLTIPGPLPMRVPIPSVSGWTAKGEAGRQWLAGMGARPYKPVYPGKIEPSLPKMWGAVYARGGAKGKPPAKVPAAKAIGAALPDIVGVAIQTGQLPAESGLAQAYGAYALQVGAKSALLKMGVAAAVAGPLSVVIGLAGLFGGLRRGRRTRRDYRRKREELRAAGAARALTYQVGYVPRTAGVRYEPRRRRGAARPFRAVYGSRLGLAATTPTPPARI